MIKESENLKSPMIIKFLMKLWFLNSSLCGHQSLIRKTSQLISQWSLLYFCKGIRGRVQQLLTGQELLQVVELRRTQLLPIVRHLLASRETSLTLRYATPRVYTVDRCERRPGYSCHWSWACDGVTSVLVFLPRERQGRSEREACNWKTRNARYNLAQLDSTQPLNYKHFSHSAGFEQRDLVIYAEADRKKLLRKKRPLNVGVRKMSL